MTAGATYFDLGRFRATAPIPSPFPHLATESFLRPEHRTAIDPDFPAIRRGGSCDLSTPAPGPAMIAAVEELRDEAMTTAVVEKFGTDLHGSLPVKSSTRRRRIVRRPASGSLMPNSRERRVPGARASRPSLVVPAISAPSFPRKRESRHPGNAGVSPALAIPAQSGIRILRAPRPLCRPAGLRPASPIGGEGDSGAGPTPSTFQSAGLESRPDR